jgi:hypothetical protein
MEHTTGGRWPYDSFASLCFDLGECDTTGAGLEFSLSYFLFCFATMEVFEAYLHSASQPAIMPLYNSTTVYSKLLLVIKFVLFFVEPHALIGPRLPIACGLRP